VTKQAKSKKHQERRLAKQAAKRTTHTDKYADRSMDDKIRRLAEHFNGTEPGDERG
jgi:hypothetical protein